MVKNLPASAGNLGLIPGWVRSPGEGRGNPLQYSGLGNPRDRGAWRAAVHGVAESDTTTWLRTYTHWSILHAVREAKRDGYVPLHYFLIKRLFSEPNTTYLINQHVLISSKTE